MSFENLEWSILVPAFIAGIIVLSSHVPLGREVLNRGIIFIDLAVAQIAGLGVILAQTLSHTESGWLVQLCAFSAALLGAMLLYVLGRIAPTVQEALIGAVFVLAATAAVLLLHNNPHGGEHLKELLAGQILWVTQSQLIQSAVFTVLLLPIWFALNKFARELSFYLTFALAVTISVQLVGVYLVFASLILPALAARQLTGRNALLVAMAVALAAYAIGLTLSAIVDWPSSPLIVWCLGLSAIVVALFISRNHSKQG